MKLQAINYISPILTEGQFTNVFVEETSVQLKRKDTYLRIDFEMYYLKNNIPVVLDSSYIAFQGMNADKGTQLSTNRKATFLFNDDPEGTEPRGLIDYLTANAGAYPENYYMVDWGYPSYEDALSYLTGGSFESREIQPLNDFVKAWILNTVIMKNELIGQQFQFIE